MFERLHHLGGRISDRVALIAGHSSAQLAFLLFVAGWLLLRLSFDILSDIVSVGAFALAQMLLNQQRRRETALHLKLDELILAIGGTRDELAGAETRSEAELRELGKRDDDPA